MVKQIHKRFTDDQVKLLLDLYLNKAITLKEVCQQLGCRRSRFFQILKKYRNGPEAFTIAYARHVPHHHLPKEIDVAIREELKKEYDLIRDPKIPVNEYNYAYTRDEVVRRIGQKVSAQTVRNRAKKWGYYCPRMKKEKSPPREVVTNAVGMLLQHDSSTHQWSPYADKPWTLITTLEDHSRYLLYADFVEREATWAHIQATQSVILKYGAGLLYYVDSHSIFRYVCHQNSIWRNQRLGTDEALTQWRIVLKKCKMQVTYALSANAKGKVERPYRWLQDRIVRNCARERVIDIEQARAILQREQQRYNEHQVHSTTGEIPTIRFEKAVREGRNCFKPFQLLPPYTSVKDIFCLHEYRKVDGYNRIMWESQKIEVPLPLPQGTVIELHILPYSERIEVRLWYQDRVRKIIYYKRRQTDDSRV